jgi:hypothetical protein
LAPSWPGTKNRHLAVEQRTAWWKTGMTKPKMETVWTITNTNNYCITNTNTNRNKDTD